VNLTLHVWRQRSAADPGGFVEYRAKDISPDMSFLEMLDVVNEEIALAGGDPIAFDNDCREGICGSCGVVVDGLAHGPLRGAAVCQLHMRRFRDGDSIRIEPWRARAFPLLRDLAVDRRALDRILASGGYITSPTGSAPEANSILIPKPIVELAMDAAECIQCGACVAACPNASAMLFTAAKISHLGLLPQGQPERSSRVRRMVEAHDREGFGNCSNAGECEAVCPKKISLFFIARLNRDLIRAQVRGDVGSSPLSGAV
jgi:succinate dehydrogenase / fumarate reductase, iron-sulfur subunit